MGAERALARMGAMGVAAGGVGYTTVIDPYGSLGGIAGACWRGWR